MSSQRFRVRITMQSNAVTRWCEHEGVTPGSAMLGRHGPIVSIEPHREDVLVEFELYVHAPEARSAHDLVYGELGSRVPRFTRLLSEHDGNTLIEVERT